MPTASTMVLVIPQTSEQQELSPVRTLFNTLLKQLNQRRLKDHEWEMAASKFLASYTSKFVPLQKTLQDLHGQFVRRLDEVQQREGLSRVERDAVAALASELASDLLNDGVDDEELLAIYKRCSGIDGTDGAYEENQAEEKAAFRAYIKESFGVDLSDEDMDSPEAAMERVHRKMAEMGDAGEGHKPNRSERRANTKTAKQRKAEATQEAFEQARKLSLREVYRRLAGLIHPDRETDPGERDKKNALMADLNTAYKNNDLLKMLEMQAQWGGVEGAAIGASTDRQLDVYNRVLQDQIKSMVEDLNTKKDEFCMRFGISPFEQVETHTINRLMALDVEGHKRQIARVTKDMALLQDPVTCKAFLRKLVRNG